MSLRRYLLVGYGVVLAIILVGFSIIVAGVVEIFHELAAHKEVEIVEGHLRPDHVHMCLRIPPKYAVSSIAGYLKGKSAITITRFFVGKERNFTGENFWARGYFVSTVGLDEATVVAYIRTQEAENGRHGQVKLRMPL